MADTDRVTSVTWKVHREVVLLLGWARAILLQVAHPLVAQGVAEHSRFLAESRGRWRRLWRTLDAMLALTFGTAAEVAEVARRINGIHDRVHGRLGGPAGRLTPEEKDRYCAEASAIEPLLGIPRGSVPVTLEGLRRYMDEVLGGGEIAVTDTARLLARAIVWPPLPRAAWPVVWFMQLPAIGLLPPPIREAYGFPWDARHESALRASAKVVRRLLRCTPSLLRHWPAARRAFRRERRAVWIARSRVA